MTCDEFRHLRENVMPHQVSRGTRAAFVRHLAGCQQCRDYCDTKPGPADAKAADASAALLAKDLNDREFAESIWPLSPTSEGPKK